LKLRLGTRASALAQAQATAVAVSLRQRGVDVELVAVRVAGDRGAPPGDKARWVADLDAMLLAGELDAAVHSAKDVPTLLAEGVAIACVPVRADPRDVLCGADSIGALAAGARVGTSSLRRAAQLRALREDLELVGVRGNVDTRLRKLDEGVCDALVLAFAGLQRLGRTTAAGALLEPSVLLPAAGQGTLAVTAPADRGEVAEALAALEDRAARDTLTAERTLVHALGAGCHTPVGGLAETADDEGGGQLTADEGGGQLRLRGFAGLPDGSDWVRDELTGPRADPEALGRALAQRMLAAGAGELVRQAEQAEVTG